MTDADDVRRLEEIERAAWEDVIAAAPHEFRTRTGLAAHGIGHACALAFRAVDLPVWNRVIGLGSRGAVNDNDIDAALAFYEGRGTRRFALHLAPLPESSFVAGRLEERGFVARTHWAKAHRGPQPPPPARTTLRIEEVEVDRAEDFAFAVCKGFEMPDVMRAMLRTLPGRASWRTYVAYDGREPVGGAALFVKDRIGWLGLGATRPTHRRRGAQGALLAWRIADAVKMGCLALATETGADSTDAPNPSLRNVLRSGFRVAYLRPSYQRPE